MTIGPLEIVLVMLPDEQRTKPIAQELKAVRRQGIIRLVDFLYITRDADGTLRSKELSDLSEMEKSDYGMILKGLLGMRAAHNTNVDVDEVTKALSLTQNDFGLTSSDTRNIAEQVPPGGSAMLALFEHVWAVKLRESVINAGGVVTAQGMLNPTALAIAGTTLEDALSAAEQIEAEAQYKVADELASANAELERAKSEAEIKLAEAQKVLDEANAEAARRLDQARVIAAANIAASVRMAAGELQEADQKLEHSEQQAEAIVAAGAEIAEIEVAGGQDLAGLEIEAGIQTAEEIKAAAAVEALRLLLEAQLIKQEATREALGLLVGAAMIKQSVADEAAAQLSAAGNA